MFTAKKQDDFDYSDSMFGGPSLMMADSGVKYETDERKENKNQ